MLWFERKVVDTLMSPTLDDSARTAVVSYVSSTLSSMPEHLRAGVAAESIVLGGWSWVENRVGRLDEGRIRTRVARWKGSKIDPIRQYVRLLESLVLFAENELAPESS
ncbi:MAG TPA: hypothetical protein VGP92_16115 [Acidimicrobiia bacterium]|nr:hypothetical protein [Acidimicrobiia bacterium]